MRKYAISDGKIFPAKRISFPNFSYLCTDDIKNVIMPTTTNQNTGTPSRLSRLQDAYEYKIKHGWTPLTPEEEVEFHKMVAEFTNL